MFVPNSFSELISIQINYKEGLHLWWWCFENQLRFGFILSTMCGLSLLLAIYFLLTHDSFWSCSSWLNFHIYFSNATERKKNMVCEKLITKSVCFFPCKLILTFDIMYDWWEWLHEIWTWTDTEFGFHQFNWNDG